MSGSVYKEVKSKLNLEYEDLGEKSVKNIKEPVQVYRVLMRTETAASVPAEKKTKSGVWRKVAIALGVIVVLLAGAAGVIWNVYFRLPDVKGVPGGMKEFALPDGPSIAVLPFDNMSDDPKQEYFSDGLTENIIAGLSIDSRLFVIARNSTFSYKGKSVKVQEVGRELGAQYVVEGSVQKTEDRIRITVQLIDAKTGHHVWSDRYDRDLKDIFSLQDEITMKIITSVGMELLDGEEYGEEVIPPSGSLKVYMKALKAAEHIHRMNKEDTILARQKYEEVIALDPEFALAYSGLALTHLMDLYFQSSDSPGISFAQANKNIKKALALNDEEYLAHFVLSHLSWHRKERDKAIAALERAIELNPNGAEAYALLGNWLNFTGKTEEGITLIKKAIQLDPLPPPQNLVYLAGAYTNLGRYEDSIEVYQQVLKRSPDNLFAQIGLTHAYGASDREEEARQQAEELLRLDPAFSLDKFAEILALYSEDNADIERYIANLRKAGLK